MHTPSSSTEVAGARRARVLRWASRLALLPLALAVAAAQAAPEEAPAVSPQRALADKAYQEDLRRYAGNTNVLVLPGLVADRARREVSVLGEATEVGADDPIEFLLISESSGHGYEALAVAFAKPSDIHRALAFIGIAPGGPANPSRLEFWPRGERVLVSFEAASGGPARVEDLVVNRRTGGTLPHAGLVFTGSRQVPSRKDPRATAYAADEYGPNAIAAAYNESASVLDVPRQAPQGDVYNSQFPNPARLLPARSPLRIVMEPERRDGVRREVDVSLRAAPGASREPPALCVELAGMPGAAAAVHTNVPGAVAALAELSRQGRDAFVALRVDEGVALGALRPLCAVLEALDTETGIRMGPPPEGELYYRAFVPDEAFRNREQRIGQPWELRLAGEGAATTGVLTRIEQTWRDDGARPELKITHHPVPAPADLRSALDRLGPGLRVILVYAPPRLTYGQLMRFVRPVLPTHSTVHVFVEGPTPGDP